MKELYEQVRRLLDEFELYTVEHVPRAQNKHADALSKRAIQKR
jgi:ribonuclease HI